MGSADKNKTLLKSELMVLVSKDSGVSVETASKVCDSFMNNIIESLCSHGFDVIESAESVEPTEPRVSLPGFGTFILKKHKGHPVGFTEDSDGSKKVINDYPVITFSVSRPLNHKIRGMPQFNREQKG